MKRLFLFVCIQFILFNVFSQVRNDSLCLYLTQFDIKRGNELKYPTNLDSCENFNITELTKDSNCLIRLFKFVNVMYEESWPGFILIENNKIEIYDLLTFSYLIKRIIKLNLNPETLKLWIVAILKEYDDYLYESKTGNAIFEFNKGDCKFILTFESIKHK